VPKLSSDSVPIQNGSIVLTKRPKSPFWQARFRIGRKWVRTSTKSSDLDEASAVAVNLHARAEIKADMGYPVVTRKFKSVAEAVKANLQVRLDSGTGKSVFRDYIQVIDNYLIPFFGSRNVGNIDHSLMSKFSQYRIEQIGREPARSTLNTHSAALRRIFSEAVNHGYVSLSQVPSLKVAKGAGQSTVRRPSFTRDEYKKLYTFMREWVKGGRRGKASDIRYLLQDYVLILANSGLRPGTETANLKWKHLEFRRDVEASEELYGDEKIAEQDEYLIINVYYGKTSHSSNGHRKGRESIPRNDCRNHLDRLVRRSKYLECETLEEAIQKDAYVFALPDGSRTNQLGRKFDQLLTDADLLLSRNDERRTLYSLRHFYITQAIINNRAALHTIAKQCGTSIGMLEKHYSHLEVWDKRKDLVR
jgi:integrase